MNSLTSHHQCLTPRRHRSYDCLLVTTHPYHRSLPCHHWLQLLPPNDQTAGSCCHCKGRNEGGLFHPPNPCVPCHSSSVLLPTGGSSHWHPPTRSLPFPTFSLYQPVPAWFPAIAEARHPTFENGRHLPPCSHHCMLAAEDETDEPHPPTLLCWR